MIFEFKTLVTIHQKKTLIRKPKSLLNVSYRESSQIL